MLPRYAQAVVLPYSPRFSKFLELAIREHFPGQAFSSEILSHDELSEPSTGVEDIVGFLLSKTLSHKVLVGGKVLGLHTYGSAGGIKVVSYDGIIPGYVNEISHRKSIANLPESFLLDEEFETSSGHMAFLCSIDGERSDHNPIIPFP